MLMHKGDAPRQLAAMSAQIPPLQQHPACRRGDQPGHQPQKRRFARAVRSAKPYPFAAVGRKTDAVQDLCARFSLAQDSASVLHANEIDHASPPLSHE